MQERRKRKNKSYVVVFFKLPVNTIDGSTSKEAWQVDMKTGHNNEDNSGLQNSYKVGVSLAFETWHELSTPSTHKDVGVGKGRAQHAAPNAH